MASTDSDFAGSVNDVLGSLMKDEIQRKVTQEVNRVLESERTSLEEATSKSQEKMQAELTRVNQFLRDTTGMLANFRKVTLPASLMRCNNCGEDLSPGEEMHVAERCGAVSQHRCPHHYHTDISQIVALQKMRKQRQNRVPRSQRRRVADHSSRLPCRMYAQGRGHLHRHHWGCV